MVPEIKLNFLPLTSGLPEVVLYSKPALLSDRKDDGDYRWRVPDEKALDLSFEAKSGYDERKHQMKLGQPHELVLCLKWLNYKLFKAAEKLEGHFLGSKNKFNDSVDILEEELKYGRRVVTLCFKYIESENLVGLVLKEDYRKNSGVAYSRSVQIEAGTYNQKGTPNVEYHQQSLLRLGKFIKEKLVVIQQYLCAEGLETSNKLTGIETRQFDARQFIVGSDQQVSNVLVGITRYGPVVSPANSPVKLLFIGREKDKPLARKLFLGLTKGNDKVLPQKIFRTKFEVHRLKYLAISEFDTHGYAELEHRLSELSFDDKSGTIGLTILPDKDSSNYHHIKAILLRYGLSSQFCTSYLVSSPTQFKWSLANIALGVFAKSGGIPWRVKPHFETSFIIGIGQAIEKEVSPEDGTVKFKRFRSFSVLTDSTGKFIELEDLVSKECVDEQYITAFCERLRAIFQKVTEVAGRSDVVAIHTPFRIKRELYQALKDVVDEFSSENTKFAVVKFNSSAENWFGYSVENNRVPVEGSWCSLSDSEYLVWFEGADRLSKLVRKRCGAPSHVLIQGNDLTVADKLRVLQDAYDLAGANWRGFNARGIPVSIYYCKLVSELLKGFNEVDEPVAEIEKIHPWFL